MNHLRRVFPITFGLALVTAGVLVACGDDDDNVTPAKDGSPPETGSMMMVDSSMPIDAPSDTSEVDSGTDTGVDAAPVLMSATANSGEIFVANDIVTASFYEEDTILHWSNAPDCVVFSRGQTKPTSAAGTLTVGGQIVGSDGGTDQVITVDPDTMNGNTYFYPGDIFPKVDTYTVNVELSTSLGFSAMPVQTLRPPRNAPVTVTAPAAPADAGAPIVIPSTAPLKLTWTVPAGVTAEQKITFVLRVLGTAAVTAKLANLYCAFPQSAGTATIPANVLADMQTRAGGPSDAQLHVFAGGAKEVKTASGSYYVEVTRTDSTTLQFDVPAKLQ